MVDDGDVLDCLGKSGGIEEARRKGANLFTALGEDFRDAATEEAGGPGDQIDAQRSCRNASSANSRFSTVCAAVTHKRSRAEPCATAGNMMGVTSTPKSRRRRV